MGWAIWTDVARGVAAASAEMTDEGLEGVGTVSMALEPEPEPETAPVRAAIAQGEMAGRTAVVTGATGFLGRWVVSELLAAGATVIAAYHGAERRQEAEQEIAEHGPTERMHWVQADLTQTAEAHALIGAALAETGRIDALLCLAGGFAAEAVEGGAWESWQRLYEQNARTALLPIQAALPNMKRQEYGRIILVGAKAALRAGRGMGAYAAAKGAVLRLTEALAAEVAGSGITANAVLPGTIDTPANRQAMPNANHAAWDSPKRLARLMLWLASPTAADVNGQLLTL